MKMLGGVGLVGNGVRMARRGERFEFADLGDLKQQMERNAEIVHGNMENFRRASAVVRTAQLLALLAVSDAAPDGPANNGDYATTRLRDYGDALDHPTAPAPPPTSVECGTAASSASVESRSRVVDGSRVVVVDPAPSGAKSLSIFGIGGVGCRIENANYWRDYTQNGRVMGRSSLFVSTLNSTPLCEAAITLGAQGSIRYVDSASEVENFLDFYPETLVLAMSIFEYRAAAGVFCRGDGNGLEDLLG